MGLSTLLRSVAGMPTGSAALVGAFWIYYICYCELSAVHEVCICPQRGHGQKKEFIIFTILSLIGLVINELIIKVSIDVLYENWTWLKNLIGPTTVTAAAKIVATAIVMVYNFITRKIFLEQKEG